VAFFSNKDYVYFYDSNRGIVKWQKDRIDPSNNITSAKKMANFFRANVMSYSSKYRILSCMRFRFPRKTGSHLTQSTGTNIASTVLTTVKTLCLQANKFKRYKMCSSEFTPVFSNKIEFVAKRIVKKIEKISENSSSTSLVETRSQLRLFLFAAAKETQKFHPAHSLDEDVFFSPVFNDFLSLGSLIVF
jgi:hypothetical protein